jgi:hypothetical protein
VRSIGQSYSHRLYEPRKPAPLNTHIFSRPSVSPDWWGISIRCRQSYFQTTSLLYECLVETLKLEELNSTRRHVEFVVGGFRASLQPDQAGSRNCRYVRIIYNSESRLPVQHLCRYSSEEDLRSLDRTKCGNVDYRVCNPLTTNRPLVRACTVFFRSSQHHIIWGRCLYWQSCHTCTPLPSNCGMHTVQDLLIGLPNKPRISP